jgi:hypothetical protein
VGDLKVPPVHPLVADRYLDKFVSAALWRLHNWGIPSDSLLLYPGLKLSAAPRSTSRLTG